MANPLGSASDQMVDEWVRVLLALDPIDRAAVLQLAHTLAQRAVSPRLNDPRAESGW